jgi:hypothetical protein
LPSEIDFIYISIDMISGLAKNELADPEIVF